LLGYKQDAQLLQSKQCIRYASHYSLISILNCNPVGHLF